MSAPAMPAVDGFGQRTSGVDSETGEPIELLDLATPLVEHAGFVTTLGERVARFAAVRHASYVHLRRLDRPSADRLELVSDFTPGWRLSELLEESSGGNLQLDITIVIALLRQLLPAVALYSRHNRDAAIGALSVERLIVTPTARLVIAEHAFGPALEKLNLGRDRLWRELRVAMPPSAGLPRANQRSDTNGIGVVALSLLLGRVLAIEEYPAQLQSLVEDLTEYRDGRASKLSIPFSNWLTRALQFDVRTAFQSPSDAQLAFESVLASDRSYVTTTAKLEEWIANVGGTIEAKKRPPEPEPPPPPPEPEPEPIPEPVATVRYVPVEESRLPIEEPRPVPESEPEHELVDDEVEVTADVAATEDAEEVYVLKAPEQEAMDEVAAYEAAASVFDTPAAARAPAVDGATSTPEAPVDHAAPTFGMSQPAAPSRMPLLVLSAVIVVLLAVVAWQLTRDTSGSMRQGEGELAVQSRPPGARVVVDGQDRGATPVTLRLPSGAHVLEVQVGKSEPRVIPLTIQAGVQTSQYIELQDVSVTGALEIRSEPSGARVIIDGLPRGTTPATIPNLSAGDHTVVLELGSRKVTQSIKIDPGATAQLVVPIPRR